MYPTRIRRIEVPRAQAELVQAFFKRKTLIGAALMLAIATFQAKMRVTLVVVFRVISESLGTGERIAIQCRFIVPQMYLEL